MFTASRENLAPSFYAGGYSRYKPGTYLDGKPVGGTLAGKSPDRTGPATGRDSIGTCTYYNLGRVLSHFFDDFLHLNTYPGKNKIINYERPYDTGP